MIKLSVTPFDVEHGLELSENKYVQNLVVGNDQFGLRQVNDFTLQMLKELQAKTSKDIWVCVNKIMHKKDIPMLEEYLLTLEEIGIYAIVFSDFAILEIVKRNNLQIKTIYSTETTITNKYFTKFAKQNNIETIELAKEITNYEIQEIANEKESKISINLHSYMYMYQSMRNLITNYKKIENGSFDQNNLSLYDQERDEYYPIIENKQGTHILASKYLCTINKLDKIINPNINFYKIDGFMYAKEEYNQIVTLYCEAFEVLINNQEYNGIDFLNKIKTINEEKTYNTGFYFKKTIY